MKAVDKTNIKWGISTIKYGSSGLEQRWRMERATLSPGYTTNWDEILSEIELTTAYEVSIESDESGKKIYSNYILRNAETRRRLQGNAEYESLKEHLDFLGREGRNLQTEIDILDRRFCILEQMVTLTMVEGHILSHYKDVIDCERNN